MVSTVAQLLLDGAADDRVREAAWAARCVGRSELILSGLEPTGLASYFSRREIEWGETLFGEGTSSRGVWFLREGLVELFIGSGRGRQIVHVMGPGDVNGDLQIILEAPFAYSARAVEASVAEFASTTSFERLLAEHPGLARRWLAGVAERISNSRRRVVDLLGRGLTVQVARLLRDEAVDGEIHLPQRTVATMLGVQRPSLNKILKDLEKRGLISVGYGRITVLEPAGLATLAD